MTRPIVLLTLVLSILLFTNEASAEQVVAGTVVRLDPAGTIYLENRQTVKVTPESAIFAPMRPVAIEALRPGTLVVIQLPEPNRPITGTVARVDRAAGVIVFQDGRAVTMRGDMTVVAPNQPVAFRSLRPGTFIVTGVNSVTPASLSVPSMAPLVSIPPHDDFTNIVKAPRAITPREPESDAVSAGIRLEPRRSIQEP